MRIVLTLLTFLATLGIHATHVLPLFLQFGINHSFLHFDRGPTLVGIDPLRHKLILMLVEFAIQRLSMSLGLFPQPRVEPRASMGTDLCRGCPLLDVAQAFL